MNHQVKEELKTWGKGELYGIKKAGLDITQYILC